MNAIQLLKSDHDKVRGLLGRLEELGSSGTEEQKGRLLDEIEMEIKVHSELEEKIFYPAFRAAATKGEDEVLFFESLEEHHVVDGVLPEVKVSKDSKEEFQGRAKVLKELIEHHAEDEEKEMFPRAQQLLGATELEELGRRMQQEKERLEKSWQSALGGTLRRVKSLADKALPPTARQHHR